MKRFRFLLVAVVGAGVLAFAAAGCGGDDSGGGGGEATALPAASCGAIRYEGEGTPELLIASDLPLQGANRALTTEMADAIEFILAQQDFKVGDKTIGYQSCDDATAQAGSWDSAKCSANARSYANNQSVVGVVGTFNSGCAKLEIPVANRAPNGPLAYVSPANTYPGLTISGPGTESGEPDNYYPTGQRNYARVVWNDQFQGAADAEFAESLGLKKVYVLTDKETYGNGIATLFGQYAKKLGIEMTPEPARGLGQEGVELRRDRVEDQELGRRRRLPRRHHLQQRRQADQGSPHGSRAGRDDLRAGRLDADLGHDRGSRRCCRGHVHHAARYPERSADGCGQAVRRRLHGEDRARARSVHELRGPGHPGAPVTRSRRRTASGVKSPRT